MFKHKMDLEATTLLQSIITINNHINYLEGDEKKKNKDNLIDLEQFGEKNK